jgi:glycosyltransferase involved in cell wall biosynthesis
LFTGTARSIYSRSNHSETIAYHNPNTSSAASLKFLYVGRLSKEKNIDLVLNAWRRLFIKGLVDSSQLIIAGDGPFSAQLDLSICDYRGYLTPSELISCYKEADCLLLPSSFEPFGAVVAEAAAFGLFLILSHQVNAKNHFLVPNINGLLVATPITAVNIAAAIQECLAKTPFSIRRAGLLSVNYYAAYNEQCLNNVIAIFRDTGFHESSGAQ